MGIKMTDKSLKLQNITVMTLQDSKNVINRPECHLTHPFPRKN